MTWIQQTVDLGIKRRKASRTCHSTTTARRVHSICLRVFDHWRMLTFSRFGDHSLSQHARRVPRFITIPLHLKACTICVVPKNYPDMALVDFCQLVALYNLRCRDASFLPIHSAHPLPIHSTHPLPIHSTHPLSIPSAHPLPMSTTQPCPLSPVVGAPSSTHPSVPPKTPKRKPNVAPSVPGLTPCSLGVGARVRQEALGARGPGNR